MELRRHRDIVALNLGEGENVAFHARNLTVASVSDEAWRALSPAELTSTAHGELSGPADAVEELKAWNDFNDPSVAADNTAFGVRSLTINVTQICNLHCTYCAAGGDGTYGDPVKKISIEKTLPQIRYFLEQLPEGAPFHIAFLGGEPLLYPEALQAIGTYVIEESAARKLRPSFKVTTNGTLINARTLGALKSIGCGVTVSMDGPAETHDLQRLTKDGKGSFAAVERGLLALLADRAGLGRVAVHAVFNEKNLDVEKAWDYFHTLPVDLIEFTYSVTGEDREATRTYNQALARVAKKAWAKGGETELTRIGAFRSIFARMDSQKRLENHCGIGKTMMVVDGRNRLWTCPWTVGRTEDRIGEGADLNYDRLERHQKTLIERNDCGDCWARFICGGGCSFVHESTAADGKLKKKNDYCERTRYLTGLALVYYHRARSADVG